MSVTITAGGKTEVDVRQSEDSKNAYPEWKSAVQAMLALAVKTKPVRDRLDQMQRWLDENPFHDQFNERHQQHHLELMDHYRDEGKLCDLSVRVDYWQYRLTEEQRTMIGAWLGVEVKAWGGSYAWAKSAQWLGTADLPTLVRNPVESCPF